MPLSWSTAVDASSVGVGSALLAVAVGSLGVGALAVGAVRVWGPSPPRPSSTAPVAMEATSTMPAAARATVLARRPGAAGGRCGPAAGSGGSTGGPKACGAAGVFCGCRRCSVHAAPSHHRSVGGAVGSGYQPGGGVMLIPAL